VARAILNRRLSFRSRAAPNIIVEFNHIIIPAADKRAAAHFLARVLGLKTTYGPGEQIRLQTGHGLTLDFADFSSALALQCAFMVTESEFDAVLVRLRSEAIDYFASFDGEGRGQINRRHGGRGIYFDGPDRHLFELIEQTDTSAPKGRIKALAIKYAY